MRRALSIPLAALFTACALQPLEIPGTTTGDTCQGDAECDDQNPCTEDRCEAGSCVVNPLSAGVACGGSADDLCSGAKTCDGAGKCVSPGAPVVDDGNSCTTDSCDPTTGSVTHAAIQGCVAWTATPAQGAPSARQRHSAIWTGSRMIVWGGSVDTTPPVTATGGVYDPVTKAWTPTSMKGAPPPRHSHTAVWTGSRMIVWGGFGEKDCEAGGGLYDPETDTWTAMATAGAPAGCTDNSEVWTGNALIVWGGFSSNGIVGTGGRYDPATNGWKALPTMNAPQPRYGHSGIWTGTRMIIWGGGDFSDWLLNGGRFDPAGGGAWKGPTNLSGAPKYREAHTAIWTGSRMVVWGGWTGGPFENSGGILDPSTGSEGTWTATSTTNAPSPRSQHTAVWTGSVMMVWGGCGGDGCSEQYGDGGIWTPDDGGGSWEPVDASPELVARKGHTAVWTGSEVIVWGGRVGAKGTDTGAQAPLP